MGKNELFLRMKERKNGLVDYKAEIEPFMERSTKIYGYLRGDKKQVKQVIRRASRARRPPPKDVEEFVINTVRHVLSNFNNSKVEKALVCMSDVGNGFEVTVCVSIFYRIQGIAELEVAFRFPNGWHVAEKIIPMLDGELKDHIDRLMKEVVNVAKYAYNVYVEAAQSFGQSGV